MARRYFPGRLAYYSVVSCIYPESKRQIEYRQSDDLYATIATANFVDLNIDVIQIEA